MTKSYRSTLSEQLLRRLTNSIIRKWEERRHFVRFLDGDIHNLRASNLGYITIKDMVDNFDSIRCDWDITLTKPEKKLVLDPVWRAGFRFTPVTSEMHPTPSF